MAALPAPIPAPAASMAPLPSGASAAAAAGPASKKEKMKQYLLAKGDSTFLDPSPCAMYKNFGLLMLVFLGLMGLIGAVVGLIAPNDSMVPAAARFIRDAAPFAIAAGAGLSAWNMFLGGQAREHRGMMTVSVVLAVALFAVFIIYSVNEGHVFYRKKD